MNPPDITKAADDLFQADKTGQQIPLLSQRYPDMDMERAYAVQNALLERHFTAGRKQIGWKIGLTSKAMQKALNIDIPDSGVLLDSMLFDSGAAIPAGRFIEPRVEAEIAFVMQADLAGADVGRSDALAATEYVTPALEILDTRIIRQDPKTGALRNVCDTIADNAANAGIVLGKARHAPDSDLRRVGAILQRNGEVEETGLGAGVLNDPVLGIVWLARRLAEYGLIISAGDIVLSGSFIRPVEAPCGSRINCDFGTFGSVSVDFATKTGP